LSSLRVRVNDDLGGHCEVKILDRIDRSVKGQRWSVQYFGSCYRLLHFYNLNYIISLQFVIIF